MDTTVSRFTVIFEDPFWIGLYEREADGKYEVSKVTFGAEPKDYEVNAYLLACWKRLKFSPSVQTEKKTLGNINPKRMQRIAKRHIADTGIGTKAQQALKLMQEQGKTARKVRTREEKEAWEERQFELRQEKRKEKHKGH